MKAMLRLAIALSVVLMLTGVSFAGIPVIAVDVDINPQSCPNPFNLGSKGVLPVAILGTEDFDVTQIDCDTVELAGAGALRCSLEDVATAYVNGNECSCTTERGDGFLDLTLKFSRQDIQIDDFFDSTAYIPLTLTGNLMEEYGGIPIRGSDCVIIPGLQDGF